MRTGLVELRSAWRSPDGELRTWARNGIWLTMIVAYVLTLPVTARLFDGDAFDLLVLPVAAFAALGGFRWGLIAMGVGFGANAVMTTALGAGPAEWLAVPHIVAVGGTVVGFAWLRVALQRSRGHALTLARSEAALHSVLANAPLIMWAVDLQGRFMVREGQLLRKFAQAEARPGELARDFVERTYPDNPELVEFLECALTGEEVRVCLTIRGVVEDAYFSPIRDRAKRITGALAVFVDVTEQRIFEAELAHRALYDALTDLPNRALLHDRLELEIAACARQGKTFALLVADLDNFKDVNDTFGHAKGDAVLCEVAKRLRSELRAADTVARLGGDEFAIILSQTDARLAATLAKRILHSFGKPLEIGGTAIDLSASLGIAMYPAHGDDPQALLRRGDIAMYVAKRTRRAYAIYSAERDEPDPDAVMLVAGLRDAIERRQIGLAFQPEVRMQDGSLLRVEALARWTHPDRGPIPPGRFVPLAERSGLMGPLTRRVLRDALVQAAAWRAEGVETVVAVNLSAQDLADRALPSVIMAALERSGLPTTALALEITESVLMSDLDRVVPELAALRDLGISLAIDDFGTGYSSLAYLSRLPVDRIKIDRSFVTRLSSDAGARAIARAAVELGHELGLHVVAEGVETRADWDLLAGLGCDSVQGYYVSRPLAPAALATWARTRPAGELGRAAASSA